mmetsp:Transcript_4275/g.13328  ORF Transcript_4275/g.13328 Transcript_4275/m.13328 type:complete len:437 (+) Transcript_4275:2073-3383(+)
MAHARDAAGRARGLLGAAVGVRDGRGAQNDVRRAVGRPAERRPGLVSRGVGRAAYFGAVPRRRQVRQNAQAVGSSAETEKGAEVRVVVESARHDGPLDVAPAFVQRRPRRVAGPRRRREGCEIHRDGAPPVHLYVAGRPRRVEGSDLPPGDLRRDHDPRGHAHVFDVAENQGHGRQDGLVGRRRRRDPRGVPLFPQGAEPQGTAPGTQRQDRPISDLRLPPREQEHDGLGPGGARAFPRPRFPGSRDESRSLGKNHRHRQRRRPGPRAHREVRHAQGLRHARRSVLTALHPLAPERTVLRRGRLLVDRLPPRPRRRPRHRSTVRRGQAPLSLQHPAHQRSLLLPRHLRLPLPLAVRRRNHPGRPKHRLLHGTRLGLGRLLRQPRRPERPLRRRPRRRLRRLLRRRLRRQKGPQQTPQVQNPHPRRRLSAVLFLVFA